MTATLLVPLNSAETARSASSSAASLIASRMAIATSAFVIPPVSRISKSALPERVSPEAPVLNSNVNNEVPLPGSTVSVSPSAMRETSSTLTSRSRRTG